MSTSNAEDRLMELLVRWDKDHPQERDLSVEELCTDCPRSWPKNLLGGIRVLVALQPPKDVSRDLLSRCNTRYLGEWREDGSNSDGVASSRSLHPRLRLHAKGGIGENSLPATKRWNREVALEEIQPHFSRDPVSRSPFSPEAEITGSLEHPGIVPVYGLGKSNELAILRDAVNQRQHSEAGDRGIPPSLS